MSPKNVEKEKINYFALKIRGNGNHYFVTGKLNGAV
jgi:hypothetical protein